MRRKSRMLFKVILVAMVCAVGAVAAQWSTPKPLSASDCANGHRLCGTQKRCTQLDLWLFEVQVCNERMVYHPDDDDG